MRVEKVKHKTLLLASGEEMPLPVKEDAPHRILFLLRHAEKDSGWDPPLTAEGKKRSRRLAEVLAEAPVSEVLATDLRRAQETGKPVAEAHQLPVGRYEPFPPSALLMRLQYQLDGRASVIVGHQNTVPALLNAVKGEAVYRELEPDDYDNLFVIVLKEEDAVILELAY